LVKRYLLYLICSAAPVIAQTTVQDPLYYLDTRDRVNAYVFRTYTDPVRLGWLAFDSAKDTWTKDPHEWDRSPESFSYRFASGWGRRIVRNTAQLGLETALREDSRYRLSGSRVFRERVLFAVSHSVLAYRPDGTVGPAYGRVAAGVIGAAASSTWHPHPMSAGSVMNGVGQSALDRACNNLLTEFAPDLRAFGRRTWNRLRAK